MKRLGMCRLGGQRRRGFFLGGMVAASVLLPLAGAARAAPIEISVVQPIASHKAVVSAAFGTVETPDHAALVAPFDGVVKSVSVRSGHAVGAGRVLLQIQPLTLASQTQAAAADVAAARADLAQQKILAGQKLVTAAALETARARLTARVAALAALQAQLHLGIVRAPFAGTVRHVAAVGTRVLQGQQLLHIDGNGALRIETAFPMTAVRGLRAGMAMTVVADGDSGPGQVYSVARTTDRYGLVAVYLTPPRTLHLMPGQVVRVRLDAATEGAWRVPQAAVVLRGTAARVFVDQGGRARVIAVKLLTVDADGAVVLGDLRPDSRVIVSDVAWLREGTPVTLKPAGPGS